MNRPATRWKIPAGAALLTCLILTVPVLTQQGFNPASVQPANCQNGKMKCGMVPANQEQMSTIEQSENNSIRHRGLPASTDLASKMPPVGNQGQQGSCVGWSSTYAIKSYHEQIERNWGYDAPFKGGQGAHVFSPAFVYNQINGGQDNGSNPVDALNLLVRTGAAPWNLMPYTDRDFRTQPPQNARSAASAYRNESFNQINFYTPDALKAELAAGNPILIGIKVYDNFYQLGSNVYDHFEGQFRGGHAITVIGYDDTKASKTGRGAFKLQNSWGPEWGQSGYGWIAYGFMPTANMAAFGVRDQRTTRPTPNQEPVPDVTNVVDPEVITELDPPAQVTASRGTFTDHVDISWSAVRNAVAYEVQRAEPTDPDSFDSIGNANGRTYTDRAVQEDVAYKYRIVAINDQTKSDADRSPVAEGFARKVVQNTAPAKVVGLSAEQAASGQINLSWTAAANARSYTVIRWDPRQRRWNIANNSVTATTYSDRTPVADATNYYRVRAVNPAGNGEWSASASAVVGGSTTPPAKVTGIQVSQGIFKLKIELRWSAVPAAQKYFVFRYDVENEEMEGPFESTVPSYVDQAQKVTSGGKFAYIIIASNAAGYSEYSDPALGFTNPNAQRAGMVLPPPQNLTARVDEAKKTITLTWQTVPVKPGEPGVAEYYIFRKKQSDADWNNGFIKNLGPNVTTYSEQIPGNPGEMYMYAVRSKSSLGNESSNSNVVAGFINAPRSTVRHRLMGGDGLERFVGTWKAVYWDGESGPQDYVLSVAADGANFKCQVKIGRAAPKDVAGAYAARSDYLETNGFKMQLVGNAQTGVVDISTRQLLPSDLQLAFLRD